MQLMLAARMLNHLIWTLLIVWMFFLFSEDSINKRLYPNKRISNSWVIRVFMPTLIVLIVFIRIMICLSIVIAKDKY